MTNKQKAEELLKVLWESQSHNPAWALREVLEKMRKQLSGHGEMDFYDEQGMMYNYGWDDCLKEIDAICDELEAL